jgi:ligand-binding sensor domain-containing protein/two-component sensor histidine kinase
MQKIGAHIFFSTISLFVALLPGKILFSQQLLFENYTSEKGLSQNSCYTIEQDAKGFMWFGTQDGLNRYDGKEFKVYLPNNSIGKNLPSNYIASLFFDKAKNLLWIGTNGGLGIYNADKDEVQKISGVFPFAALLDTLSVKKIVSFAQNEYWVVTATKGLLLLNTVAGTVKKYFSDDENSKRVSAVTMHNGKLYVALLQQLYQFTYANNKYEPKIILPDFSFQEIKELYSYNNELWVGSLYGGCFRIKNPVDDKDNIQPFTVTSGGFGSFATDADSNLWMGTRGNGIIQYNAVTHHIQTAVNNKYNSRSIGKNFILSLFKDRQGLIWCGLSGGGVAKYDPSGYRFENINNEPLSNSSLPDNMVFDIFKASDGNYYVGTQNKGLASFNTQTALFTNFPQSATVGTVINTIYDITEDNHENLWMATWGGLMKMNLKTKKINFTTEKNILSSAKFYGIHKLKNADSLFLSGENEFIFYSLKENKWKPVNKKQWQADRFVGRYTYEDDAGVLWICTVGNGLLKYQYKTNKLEVVEPVKKYATTIRHLFPDGDLFFLSTDNGIILYNFKTGKVEKQVALNNGNISNVCYAIQKDQQGFYWAGSNNGLYKINPKDYSVHNFDIGDGLSFLEYNTACAVTQQDGTFLFGGVGGITRFNPQRFAENKFSPSPVITSVMINDSLLSDSYNNSANNKIVLDHNQNFITVVFAVTNFSKQHKNSFAYQLTGIDKDWVYNGAKNTASYTSLPPGEYTFQLKSANSDGLWCDKPVSIKIIINPPWWQTWWFRLLSILSLAGAVTFLIQRRIKTIRQQAELKHKIAEVEMTSLRLQMNPHFLFNSLNSINSFIVENKTHLASDYLTKFSRLMRLILENSKNESIPLEKEIETLKLYLLMESIRFDKKFDYAVDIDEKIDEQIKVPPMIIQPYAENAIWHGLLHKKERGKVEIGIKKENGSLQIIIEDNGIGRTKAAEMKSKNSTSSKSYGMQITEQRIKQLDAGNKVTTIDLTDDSRNATGTKVIITIKATI